MTRFFAFFSLLIATSAAGQNYISGQPCYLSGNVTKCFKPINAASGGTGVGTLTSHGVLVGEGTGNIVGITAGTNGQILVGSTGADPAFGSTVSAATTFSGGLTVSAGALTVSETTGGSGNVPHICAIVTSTDGAGSASANATCASGKIVMGGGCTYTGTLAGSIKESNPTSATAWQCVFSTAPTTAAVAKAICCTY